jgi:molybdate transport system substrate-binding protein
MRRSQSRSRLIVLSLIVIAVLVTAERSVRRAISPPKPSAQSLLVHCGNSMRPAAEEIAEVFTKRYETRIEFNYGGSETLLPQIITRKQGDILITHDPFGNLIEEKGLLTKAVTVGYLTPVIIVPKGNPQGISGLDDLLRRKLRVGVTDPRYATCGALVEEKLRERGIAQTFNEHPNFVLQTRSHGDVAAALLTNNLDAGIVWNFIGVNFGDKVDTVAIDEEFPDTRVVICLLNTSVDTNAAARFLNFAASDKGRKVFADHGYSKTTK